MNEYRLLIENLMQFFTQGEFTEEAVAAKNEFYELAGVFDEESENFEQKMAQFVDWYIFSRKIKKFDSTPINLIRDKKVIFEVSEEERSYLKSLCLTRHSLFEFLKVKGSDLYIKDLFSEYKHIIKDSDITIGFDKGQVFEARMIPHGESFKFSSSFCFHSYEANKFISNEVKKVKKLADDVRDIEREALIQKLFKMSYKFEQYKHVKVEDIYSNDSKLRI